MTNHFRTGLTWLRGGPGTLTRRIGPLSRFGSAVNVAVYAILVWSLVASGRRALEWFELTGVVLGGTLLLAAGIAVWLWRADSGE